MGPAHRELAASGDGRHKLQYSMATYSKCTLYLTHMLSDLERSQRQNQETGQSEIPARTRSSVKELRTCVTYWRVGSRLKALQA